MIFLEFNRFRSLPDKYLAFPVKYKASTNPGTASIKNDKIVIISLKTESATFADLAGYKTKSMFQIRRATGTTIVPWPSVQNAASVWRPALAAANGRVWGFCGIFYDFNLLPQLERN